jgi:hypothetical protein
MAFPSNPTNGQTTTQNGLVYTYNSTLTAWVLSTSTTGDISANAITALGNITTIGNITGDYLLGNGSQLTGISVSTDKIFNGNSYANIPVADGNVVISANGQLWTFDTTGNLTTAGAVAASSISASGNVTVTGAVAASSISASGNVTVTGAITADSVTTASIPLVLDDISNQCDGAKMVFALQNNTSNITSANITDSKNLQVAVNGLVLSPWVNIQNFIWYPLCFSGFPTSSPGYQVNTTASSANITFYRSPAQGSQVVLTIISNSSSTQVRKYPFTASYIALGV